jgi:hypothetical protein
MLPRRLLQHAVILLYLTVTFGAFFFTMTKHEFPFLPYPVIHWSYGMMAPYQGDTDWNADLRAEGLKDGSWERIDLNPYFPFGHGEKNVRMFLRIYLGRGLNGQRDKYTELALQILDRERERGKEYASVRLYFDTWWRSPDGFEALRLPGFTESEFLTQVQ